MDITLPNSARLSPSQVRRRKSSSLLIRLATRQDVGDVTALMRRSTIALAPAFYDPHRTQLALQYITDPDLDLIGDGTYFLAFAVPDDFTKQKNNENDVSIQKGLEEGSTNEMKDEKGPAEQQGGEENIIREKYTENVCSGRQQRALLVGCGGWSARRKLFTGNAAQAALSSQMLDPETEPAKIRAFFVDAGHARRGVGSAIYRACEQAARTRGFRSLELLATLPGVPFYSSLGFRQLGEQDAPLINGEILPCMRMCKTLDDGNRGDL